VYKIDEFSYNLGYEQHPIQIQGSIDRFPLRVTDVTSDTYKLSFDADISAGFNVEIDMGYFDLGDGNIKISGTLNRPQLQGTMIVKKSNLGLVSVDAQISGILSLVIEEQPFIPLPIRSLPIPLRISLDGGFNTPFTVLEFPMGTGNEWGLPEAKLNLDGEVRSIWFNVLNVVNKIAKLFGVELLPDNIAGLLPVIGFRETFEALDLLDIYDEYLDMAEYTDIFNCVSTEQISTSAGSFSAYKISIMDDIGFMYYAPEVGNIVKISGFDINAELIDYTV
jgi:hypothetical protein